VIAVGAGSLTRKSKAVLPQRAQSSLSEKTGIPGGCVLAVITALQTKQAFVQQAESPTTSNAVHLGSVKTTERQQASDIEWWRQE